MWRGSIIVEITNLKVAVILTVMYFKEIFEYMKDIFRIKLVYGVVRWLIKIYTLNVNVY